jgi:exodeoxyribonuclease VII small subunit
MVMEQKFDYSKAIEELEAIAARVEDPKTVIEDIDKYIKRSEELISACREYLRGVREKVDAMSGNL